MYVCVLYFTVDIYIYVFILFSLFYQRSGEKLCQDLNRANNNLNVPLQSAYRQNHCTETTLLKVHNDFLLAMDQEYRYVFLILLDLSAAFDTVDHTSLQARLTQDLGIEGAALQWVESYITDRQQIVTIRGVGSKKRAYITALSRLKITVASLAKLIQTYEVNFHGYADDTQPLRLLINQAKMRNMLMTTLRAALWLSDPGWLNTGSN